MYSMKCFKWIEWMMANHSNGAINKSIGFKLCAFQKISKKPKNRTNMYFSPSFDIYFSYSYIGTTYKADAIAVDTGSSFILVVWGFSCRVRVWACHPLSIELLTDCLYIPAFSRPSEYKREGNLISSFYNNSFRSTSHFVGVYEWPWYGMYEKYGIQSNEDIYHVWTTISGRIE